MPFETGTTDLGSNIGGSGGGGGSGVTSLNTLTGALTLVPGAGIVITPNSGAGTITIASTLAGGTVTSVGLALPASVFSISGSPVTTSGTLTGSFINQAANTVFAGPASGASSAPAFRALVSADIPNNAANTTGTASNITATSNSTLTSLPNLVLPGGQVSGFTSGSVLFAGATGRISQDNSNFFWNDTTFNLGLGVIPATNITLDTVNTTGTSKAIQNTSYGVGSTVPFRGRFARGTIGSPAAAQAGDTLSTLSGRGYGTSQFAVASTGAINTVAGETFTNTSNATYLQFQVTPTGSVTIAEAMRLNSTGNLLIGTTTDSGTQKLQVNGNSNVGTVTAGTWNGSTIGVPFGGTGLSASPTNGQLLIGNGTNYTLNPLTAGPGITITNGAGTIQINNSSIGVGTLDSGLIGDGVDGSVTISGNTTLARDMYYSSLTVNAGVTLNTGGFTIFCDGTITVNATGIISRNGNNGGNSATTAAGAAGTALADVTVGSSIAGAAGGAGATGAGASGGTSGAVNGEGGSGGVGGNGGVGSGGAGGSGGNSGTVNLKYFRNVQPNWKYTAVGTFSNTGGGGAGGAAGGGDGTNSGRGGGGGGSGGGGILMFCNALNNLGTIEVLGGNGGNGGGTPVGNVGGGAGGGGGGGGKIMIFANTLTSRGTLNVSGGNAGSGSAGAGTGSAGTNGAAGSPGYATTFEASTGTWTTTQ